MLLSIAVGCFSVFPVNWTVEGARHAETRPRITTTVIHAVDRGGQHQLGRYQRDDGKACNTQ